MFNPLVQNQVVNNLKILMAVQQQLRGGIIAELSLNEFVMKYRNYKMAKMSAEALN